ncbi:ribonuclease H family protein [Microbacterium hydrocarbonoxydans]|uniref:ribonuclease H family protein n=1 Tax=Microbacterium hydrocarbonoxydans TaxID=273678 RepID=UPI0013DBD295|nr:ribonuclease H [Microbacterium hydrocarbonoxydans]
MTITAAADGSALGNPGPNGWAWYIDDANWAAGGSPHGTNNQGELQAVLELLRATAGTDEKLLIECDSKYVIDSVTKWMPGWKRRGWRKADGAPVLNRELLEGIDEAMRGRQVEFSWVKGHAGHPLNEAADERANAAATAYKQKQEPRRGPGFTRATDAGAAVAGSAAVAAGAGSGSPGASSAGAGTAGAGFAAVATGADDAWLDPAEDDSWIDDAEARAEADRDSAVAAAAASAPSPAAAASLAEPLWAEASDLFEGLDDEPADDPIELRITLSGEEHARLADRAQAQGVTLEEALRRLI